MRRMKSQNFKFIFVFIFLSSAPPCDKEASRSGLTKLCERVINVLFEIWIISCYRHFPNPSFWKTFYHLCCSWRHQPSLIDQRSQSCLIFTQRLLQLTYAFPLPPLPSDSQSTLYSAYFVQLLQKMKSEVIYEAWFRFLNIIGNPIDLHSPSIISKTCKFYENIADTRQYMLLSELPQNFYHAMRGLALIVNLFLSLPVNYDHEYLDNEMSRSSFSISNQNSLHRKSSGARPLPSTPKFLKKRGILESLTYVSRTSTFGIYSQKSSQNSLYLPQNVKSTAIGQTKPLVNSVLNVLGNWLFSACMLGSESTSSQSHVDSSSSSSSSCETSTITNDAGNDDSGKKSTVLGSEKLNVEYTSPFVPENFEAGQAEAIGALCRLFSSKRNDEEISSVYLARFYLALQCGLSVKEVNHFVSFMLIVHS